MKFKAGDVVRSTRSNRQYQILNADGQYEVLSDVHGNTMVFTKGFFEDGMELVEPAPPDPTTAPPAAAPSATPTKPNYYRFEVRGQTIDIIDVIQGLELGCEAGNVYKYLARAGRKAVDTHVEDLEKAREWLDRLIEFKKR